MKNILKVFKKLIQIISILAAAFFVITFLIYYFNLDMKLTAALEPYLEKWHDRVKRERKL